MNKNIPMPAKFWKRKDDSLGMAFGDPFKGAHEQFDFEGSEDIAAFIVKAVNCHDDLLTALKLARAYMSLSLGSPTYEGENPYPVIDAALKKAGVE